MLIRSGTRPWSSVVAIWDYPHIDTAVMDGWMVEYRLAAKLRYAWSPCQGRVARDDASPPLPPNSDILVFLT
jgi:hypothetical protein